MAEKNFRYYERFLREFFDKTIFDLRYGEYIPKLKENDKKEIIKTIDDYFLSFNTNNPDYSKILTNYYFNAEIVDSEKNVYSSLSEKFSTSVIEILEKKKEAIHKLRFDYKRHIENKINEIFSKYNPKLINQKNKSKKREFIPKQLKKDLKKLIQKELKEDF